MEWKGLALVLGISMLILAAVGIGVHADMRLVGADILGAAAAIAILFWAGRGRGAGVGVPILAAIALLVMALLTVTSHRSPVLMALTLAFAFALAFVSWTALSGGTDAARRPPRPV